MKNRLPSPLLLLAILLLGAASASATKTIIDEGFSSLFINGGPRSEDINMYAESYMDHHFTKNQLALTINETLTIPTNFLIPQLIEKGPGCLWSISETPWSVEVTEGENLLSYASYTEYTDETPLYHHVTIFNYNLLAEGKAILKVKSDPTKSDFTSYTMTLNIKDNLSSQKKDSTSSINISDLISSLKTTKGGPVIVAVPLYAIDWYDGSIAIDDNGNYKLNQFDIELGTSIYPFSFAQPTEKGYQWINNQTTWTLNQVEGTDTCFIYASSTSSHSPTTCSLKTTFTALKAGYSQIRVTSSKNPNYSGTIDDGSDEVAYTMTIVVIDNSPKKSSAPSPTPPSN